MDKRYLSEKVAEWYKENMRNLPWRKTNDPYKIWISEIILQQTRVSQGLEYYKNFVKTFPTIRSLAIAREDKVLRLWQGLGYYTRARNLHRCAKTIVKDYKGKFPSSFEDLKKLPGIGDYTAAAIASIAFHQPAAVVDGNVYRVLSRFFGIDTPIDSTKGKKEFSEIANQLILHDDPGTHNQAIMEFGALQCIPKNPNCSICPLRKNCIAHARGTQQLLPVKEGKTKTTSRHFYYFVIQHSKSLLMKKREGKDIWHGLYEFYLIEKEKRVLPESLHSKDTFLRSLNFDKKNLSVTQPYKHVLSHQVIHCQFILLTLSRPLLQNGYKMKFYDLKKVNNLPKPVLIGKYLQDCGFL